MPISLQRGDIEAILPALEEQNKEIVQLSEKVEVDTVDYEQRSKKSPSGRDNWMFQFKDRNGQADVFEYTGDYSKALDAAKKAAARVGAKKMYLV